MIRDYKYLDPNSLSSQLAREAKQDKPESIFHMALTLIACFVLLYGTIEIFTLIEMWSL